MENDGFRDEAEKHQDRSNQGGPGGPRKRDKS